MNLYRGIIFGLLLGAAFSIVAFIEPTQAPPSGNVDAPLNAGSAGQSKAGGLIINTGGATNGLIVQTGNVGIGTASPSRKLFIYGTDASLTVDSTANLLQLSNSVSVGASDPYRTGITMSANNTVGDTESASIEVVNESSGNSDGYLGLFHAGTAMVKVHSGNSGPAAYILFPTGNVGIGTTNPGQKLTVAGTIESTSGGFKFPDGTTQATAAGAASTPNLQSVTNVGRTTSQNIQSPRFEDYDNSGYYLDPNSSSNLSGNVTASDFYSNAAGRWFSTLSSWMNQSVTTGASPTFNDLYLSTQGTWLSSRINQSVRTDASPSFSNVTSGGQNVCRSDGTYCPSPSQNPGNRFGGLYTVSTNSNVCYGTFTSCTPNPFTGGCSCPSGYSQATAFTSSVFCGDMFCPGTCTTVIYQCYR